MQLKCNRSHIKTIAIRLFQIACFVPLGSMIYKQLKLYIDNEDSSSVSYRKFNDEENDLYPTFSFCFQASPSFEMFKDENFLGVEGISNRVLYSSYLKGTLEDEHQMKNTSENFTLINFEDVVVPVADFLNAWENYGRKISEYVNKKWWLDNSSLPHFIYKSYQFHDMMCVTNKREYQKDFVLDIESIDLNLTRLLESNVFNVDFYLHQSGHLTNNLIYPILSFDSTLLSAQMENSSTLIEVHITQVEQLQKRDDAQTPCDATLKDTDRRYREAITKDVGCVPAYWEVFRSNLSLKEHLDGIPKCKTQKQYRDFASQFGDYDIMENGQKLYVQPCKEMAITRVMRQIEDQRTSELLRIDVHYDWGSYKLIKNSRSLNLEGLWSQIGGFVGIFLGYSLLQLPDVLLNVLTGIRNITREKQKRRNQRMVRNTTPSQSNFGNSTPSNNACQITRPNDDSLSSPRSSTDMEICLVTSYRPRLLLNQGGIKDDVFVPDKVNIEYNN